MVGVPGLSVCIDRYEAARSDATSTSAGTSSTATSRRGVRSWGGATLSQASTACTLAAKRLCTRAEWRVACEGGTGRLYPYGNTFDAGTCNTSFTLPPDGGPQVTGAWPGCEGGLPGLFDMAGLLQELHSDVDTTSPGCSAGAPCRRTSGSAYFQGEPESRCSFSTATPGNTGHVGFRCCRAAP